VSALTDPTRTRSDRLSALRGNALLPLAMTGAALTARAVDADGGTHAVKWHGTSRPSALLGGAPEIDNGTRVVVRYDYRPIIEGTSLTKVSVEGPIEPFRKPTRMMRIRAIAPLSYRDWGSVFGVSHSAVKQWADGEEPDRPKLDRILNALSEASIHHRDLAAWLTTPLPGMEIRPMDLLRDERWRAFRGAMRARSALPVTVAPEELARRRRAQSSWVVAEPATVADEA
jgi:hypothetical protein